MSLFCFTQKGDIWKNVSNQIGPGAHWLPWYLFIYLCILILCI